MNSFLNNRLLTAIILALAAYWSLGWYIPGAFLSITLSIFSVLAGLAITVRYFQGVYGVIVRGDRSDDGDGAHLAAIGIPAIAASIVYGGMFTLAWNLAGAPQEWLGTPASNFSRVLLVSGCIALYLTPDVQRERLSLPSVIWLVILGATAVLAAFLLGAYVGQDKLIDINRIRAVSLPVCEDSRPIWVASNSTLFHGPDSPWHDRIVPRRCFATPLEAVLAGFHPAPSS